MAVDGIEPLEQRADPSPYRDLIFPGGPAKLLFRGGSRQAGGPLHQSKGIADRSLGDGHE